MADTISTKRITDLPEDTGVNDNDLFMAGSNGTASLRKKKWSTLLAKIKSVLLANNRTTTVPGYALDARQGKELQDEIDQLNTKTDYLISLNSYVQGNITAKKCGNVVYINGMVYFNNSYNTYEWKSIASGFPVPDEFIYVGNQFGYMRINTSGVLEIYPPVTGNVQIPFNFTYLP
ncbi:MAG TPA: hypothetical protein IAB31_02670 [Candidatus Choladousia intestinavium]|uniref:Uncharacterized protein n=1 Tax=Candidatus Choladousia intestinavium TaxID=2840727 RepID=A0A9D1D8H3_9FIRM|nr:hypothetical protein [Candidatus Choladousia intestinavium]